MGIQRARGTPIRRSQRSGLLLAILVAGSLTAGCRGPFLLLPGGALEGAVQPVPGDWSSLGPDGLGQLETVGPEPYSVNIVYTVLPDGLYVNAGGTRTRWVENLIQNPLARLGVEGAIYELRAERVTEARRIAAFAQAWNGQSMFRRDPLGYEEVWIFRLVGR